MYLYLAISSFFGMSSQITLMNSGLGNNTWGFVEKGQYVQTFFDKLLFLTLFLVIM